MGIKTYKTNRLLMPLKKDENGGGTNADGSKSKMYLLEVL